MGGRFQDMNLFPAPRPSLCEFPAKTVGFEFVSHHQKDGSFIGKDGPQTASYRDYATAIVEDEDEESGNVSSRRRQGNNYKFCSRGHWRPAEDAKLKELVAQFGPQNWNLIAERLDGRSGKSCRLRWFNQLDPRINKGAFTEEEEERLLEAHRLHGTKWALISRLFPGRTDNAVKNHWHVIMARKLRDQADSTTTRHRIRRKLLPPPTPVPAASHKNASSESTDESGISTCTELSLSPSTAAAATLLFGRRLVPQIMYGKKGFMENGGSSHYSQHEEEESGKNDSETQMTTVTVGGGGGDSLNTEDCNSAAAAESDSVSRRDSTGVTFIDFLGVGRP